MEKSIFRNRRHFLEEHGTLLSFLHCCHLDGAVAHTERCYPRHTSAAPGLQVNLENGLSQQKHLFRFKCHLYLSVFIPLLADLFLLSITNKVLGM